jgi:hypothetical protein
MISAKEVGVFCNNGSCEVNIFAVEIVDNEERRVSMTSIS